jgi:hypothetical protein
MIPLGRSRILSNSPFPIVLANVSKPRINISASENDINTIEKHNKTSLKE